MKRIKTKNTLTIHQTEICSGSFSIFTFNKNPSKEKENLEK